MFERKRFASALMVASMLTFGTAVPPAQAQPDRAQAGLINVNVEITRVIDDVTVVVQDVNVSVAAAANIVAQVCGNNIGVAALIAELEQFGEFGGVCSADNLSSVVVTENN